MEKPTYDPNSLSNILSYSTLSDFLTEMTYIILTLNVLKVIDSCRIIFRKHGLILSELFWFMERSKNLEKQFHNSEKENSFSLEGLTIETLFYISRNLIRKGCF